MKIKKTMLNLFVVFCLVMSFLCFWICFLLDLNQKHFSSVMSWDISLVIAFGGGVMSTLLMLIAFQSRKDVYEKLKVCYVNLQNKLTAQDDYNAIFKAVEKNDILTASHDDISCELETIFTREKPYQSKNGFIFFEKGTLFKTPKSDINSAKALSNKTFYNKLSSYREHSKKIK